MVLSLGPAVEDFLTLEVFLRLDGGLVFGGEAGRLEACKTNKL